MRWLAETRWAEGLVLGLLVSTVFLLIVRILVEVEQDKEILEAVIDSTGVVIAVAAIYFALVGVRKQVAQQYDLQRENGIRRERVARAKLPIALAELMSSTEQVLRWHLDPINEVVKPWTDFEDPLKELGEAIEWADNETARHLLTVIAGYQVLKSRMQDALREASGAATLEDFIISRPSLHWEEAVNWGVFHRLVGRAFDYARGRSEIIKQADICIDDALNAFSIASQSFFPDERHPPELGSFFAYIDRARRRQSQGISDILSVSSYRVAELPGLSGRS